MKNTKLNNRFKVGSGCFECINCGKLTRNTGQSSNDMCAFCEDKSAHENFHSDNDLPNDDCGEVNCPVKNYSKEEKWWLR